MDNGNYAPIYQQLSGNYIGPTYLPQTQQIQQLDYSFPNGKEIYLPTVVALNFCS